MKRFYLLLALILLSIQIVSAQNGPDQGASILSDKDRAETVSDTDLYYLLTEAGEDKAINWDIMSDSIQTSSWADDINMNNHNIVSANQVSAINWDVTDSILFEGATADSAEIIVNAQDPAIDTTFTLQAGANGSLVPANLSGTEDGDCLKASVSGGKYTISGSGSPCQDSTIDIQYTGDVPVDNEIARYSGPTGLLIKKSGVTISDTGVITAAGFTSTGVGPITNTGAEAGDASIYLDADESDDAADLYYITSKASDNSFRIGNNVTDLLKISSAGLLTVNSQTLPAQYNRSFTIQGPLTSDDYCLGSFPANITIRQVRILVIGGTNVVGGLDEADANGGSAAAIDSDITASAGTTATDDGTLSNATVDANDLLCWHTTTVSGTPTYLTGTVYFTYDAI